MICMCKLLNFPGERVALQCANGALTGSHSQFYDGSRTDWFVLCCCRVSEETLIHWHKHRGFTDSLRGADTFRSDTNEFIGKKNDWFNSQETFLPVQSIAKTSLQSSWHRHSPKWTNSCSGWTLSPLNGLREMAFLKQTSAGNRQEQSRVLGSQLLFAVLITSQAQILCKKHCRVLTFFLKYF